MPVVLHSQQAKCKLHYVIESANMRRTATSYNITLCAQQLTDKRGLDGFTMDDLATAAGVSRRTLFNYFPSKLDAVLGEWPVFDEGAVAVFRAGGPEHDLVLDLRNLILTLLDDETVERDVLTRSRRILIAHPRLLGLVHERYETLSAETVEHIVVREGSAFGAVRAKVAVVLLASLLDASLDAYLHDELDRPIAHHFDESLRTARSLLGA